MLLLTNSSFLKQYCKFWYSQSKLHLNDLTLHLLIQGPGILTRAVFSKCFFEVLTSSSKTSQWDVSGLPVLSSSHVTLGEWMERAQQLHKVSTALWTNLAVSSIADFRYDLFSTYLSFKSSMLQKVAYCV